MAMTLRFSDLMKRSLISESSQKPDLNKGPDMGTIMLYKGKPCFGDVVCAWCACQAIYFEVRSGQANTLGLSQSL